MISEGGRAPGLDVTTSDGRTINLSNPGKPLVLYPRRAALGEHRNDHQMATAAAMEGRSGVAIAYDDTALERLLMADNLPPFRPGASPGLPQLVAAVREFVAGR